MRENGRPPVRNNRSLGSIFEQETAEWLQDRGYRIIARNYRCRIGEIDLIAARGELLAFVEVKYRSSAARGFSEDAVGPRKQRTIRRVAEYFLSRNTWAADLVCRFDVAAFEFGRLHYYEGAFGGI